jgi:hypothetical protein
MEHRSSGSLVSVHQRIGRAGSRPDDAEAAGNRLDQRRLPCPEITFEGDQLTRTERTAEGLSLRIELGLRQ